MTQERKAQKFNGNYFSQERVESVAWSSHEKFSQIQSLDILPKTRVQNNRRWNQLFALIRGFSQKSASEKLYLTIQRLSIYHLRWP